MLTWVLIFLAISLVAGLLGFTGISEGAAEIAQIVFFFFLVLLLLGLVLMVFPVVSVYHG